MKIVHGLQLAVISTLVCASLCPAQNTSSDGVRLYAMERLVPVFNTSRAETLASIDRVERLAKNLKATVVVQHATEDFGRLPQFPDYWQ